MGPATPMRLNDRDVTLRYELRNARLATMLLQNFMPQQGPKLDLGQAAMLVLRGDLDAIVVFLWQGLLPDQERLTQQQVERWLGKEITAGREMTEFTLPILDALKAARLITINYRSTSEPGADEEVAEGNGRPSMRAVESSRE